MKSEEKEIGKIRERCWRKFFLTLIHLLRASRSFSGEIKMGEVTDARWWWRKKEEMNIG
jgi:hypothetical protein